MTHSQPMRAEFVLGLIALTATLIGLNFSILKFALDHTTPVLLAGSAIPGPRKHEIYGHAVTGLVDLTEIVVRLREIGL